MLKKKKYPRPTTRPNPHCDKNNNNKTGAYGSWPTSVNTLHVWRCHCRRTKKFPLSQQGILSRQNQGFLGNLVPNKNWRADRNWCIMTDACLQLGCLPSINLAVSWHVRLSDNCSLYTDVVLFCFPLFSKTSASEASAREREWARERKIYYHPCSTDFEEKIEGLWTGYDNWANLV